MSKSKEVTASSASLLVMPQVCTYMLVSGHYSLMQWRITPKHWDDCKSTFTPSCQLHASKYLVIGMHQTRQGNTTPPTEMAHFLLFSKR